MYWASQFSHFCILDNHENDNFEQRFQFIAGIDQIDFFKITADNYNSFESWKSAKKSMVFGLFSYELNHSIHKIPIKSQEHSLGYFFEPRYLIQIRGNKVEINRNYPETYDLVVKIQEMEINSRFHQDDSFKLKCNKTKEKYIEDIIDIKLKIEEGTFYEINYCMEWMASNAAIDPCEKFYELNALSKAPFSAFLKMEDQYILCASPERFLKKEGLKLLSQPIKGTIKRNKENREEDEKLKSILLHSEKERAENIMIVDLVRHDLTPYSMTGSIKVVELFGIYAFEFVFQMISSIEATLVQESDALKALKYAFPPGSMTGAPKHEVMKQIEKYESFSRNYFSGSIGYIDENQDFDFNVVIRSCFYNDKLKNLSIKAGSAITYESIPEAEYDECLLKANALIQLLSKG